MQVFGHALILVRMAHFDESQIANPFEGRTFEDVLMFKLMLEWSHFYEHFGETASTHLEAKLEGNDPAVVDLVDMALTQLAQLFSGLGVGCEIVNWLVAHPGDFPDASYDHPLRP